MTAHPTDIVRLEGPAGAVDLNCIEYGIPWPPPAQITHIGGTELDVPFNRIDYSKVADDDPAIDTETATANCW